MSRHRRQQKKRARQVNPDQGTDRDDVVNFEVGRIIRFGWELPETEPKKTLTVVAVDHAAGSVTYRAAEDDA